MTLTTCRECQQQVSHQAKACPNCGAPYPAQKEWKGKGFEWKSERTLYGLPLVHIAFGRNAKGKLRVAKGIVAIGQFAIGVFTFAQIGVALIFGFGQVIFAPLVIAQVAIGLIFGLGQLATGYVAIGQLVVAYYGIGQTGLAHFLWSTTRKDPEAAQFFSELAKQVGLSVERFFNR